MSDPQRSDNLSASKVVSFPGNARRRQLPDRLEEIRSILNAADDDHTAQDGEAVANAEVFYDRFGFNWKRQEDRAALIALKHELSLKDREIRMFFMTGNLKIDSKGATLVAYPSVAVAAGFIAGMSTYLGIAILLMTAYAYVHSNQLAGIGLIFSLIFFAVTGVALWSQVLPAIVQRRTKNQTIDHH